MLEKAQIKTPIGYLLFQADDRGLFEVSFHDLPQESVAKENLKNPYLIETIRQFEEYLAGNRQDFELQLNPEGTDFQKQVWEELCKIPYGVTISYLELAHRIGNPKAVRAVAAANGQNPIAVIIPCHRVIGSDGSLTGYASGLHRKKWLLTHEGTLSQLDLFS